MDRNTALSEFLKAARSRRRPEDVALATDTRTRRVAGLRREEVARLAGISTDYYIRLEQGRAGLVSTEVRDSIADALGLDAVERDHLANLMDTPSSTRQRRSDTIQRVRPGIRRLLETLDDVPAFVLGRRTDVLAANALARAVLTDFDALPAIDRNFAKFMLLDPAARERCVDWPRLASETVAMLRLDGGRYPQDRRLADLIGELTLRSPEFTRWWSDQRVHQRTHGEKRYRHPLVGELVFQYEALRPADDSDQTLCVYCVESGSKTAEALKILASWQSSELAR